MPWRASDGRSGGRRHRPAAPAGGRPANSRRRPGCRAHWQPWLDDGLEMLLQDSVRHLAELDEAHVARSIDEDAHREPHVYTILRRDLTAWVVNRREMGVHFAEKGLH